MRKISEERKKELVKTCPIIYREIVSGRCEKLEELIKEHDDYLEFALHHGFVKDAIEKNNLKALKVFLDAGVHPDSIAPDGVNQTLLWHAIGRRAYNSATFLLDAGADVNHTDNRIDGKGPSPLTSAASSGDLKMVKMLLERGANIHYTYYYEDVGSEKLNALKLAVMYEHHEVADYLRSLGAVVPE